MESDGAVQIANEFTLIRVKKVLTGNGERLQISSPRLGFEIELDPLELESLTWQTTDTFSRMLDTPFGPGTKMNVGLMSDLLAGEEREQSDSNQKGD